MPYQSPSPHARDETVVVQIKLGDKWMDFARDNPVKVAEFLGSNGASAEAGYEFRALDWVTRRELSIEVLLHGECAFTEHLVASDKINRCSRVAGHTGGHKLESYEEDK